MAILHIGTKYSRIYDDKGRKPVRKFGTVVRYSGNLFELDSGEILNEENIIRATVDGGNNANVGKD